MPAPLTGAAFPNSAPNTREAGVGQGVSNSEKRFLLAAGFVSSGLGSPDVLMGVAGEAGAPPVLSSGACGSAALLAIGDPERGVLAAVVVPLSMGVAALLFPFSESSGETRALAFLLPLLLKAGMLGRWVRRLSPPLGTAAPLAMGLFPSFGGVSLSARAPAGGVVCGLTCPCFGGAPSGWESGPGVPPVAAFRTGLFVAGSRALSS